MLAQDLMTKKVITVTPETLVSEVADLLHKYHFSGLPVVNEEGRVLGTISERDFISSDSNLYLPTYIKMLSHVDYVQGSNKKLPHVVEQIVNAKAKDIMNQSIPFARPQTTIEEIARMFAEQRVNPVPVTDSTNKLLGVISRSDLIKFFSPSMVRSSYIPQQEVIPKPRMIDSQVSYTQSHFAANFAYVAKARANIWLTATVVLFLVGFIAGIIYVADPNILRNRPTVQYLPLQQ
ncbi:MAG TPA: CBS domain-containing protein [Candidatus Doudnabacteria bacterium]|nr:CBS domain-containing protein [Candidatus Doudnabacteria bacterium]